MDTPFLNDFDFQNEKFWKQKIQFSLEGEDYVQKLIKKSIEGIDVKPFYHHENFKKLKLPNYSTDLKICQTIFISNENTANKIATKAIEEGAQSILFIVSKRFNYKNLLKGLENIELQFEFLFFDKNFIQEGIEFCKNQTSFFNIDPIGQLAKTGNWHSSQKGDFEALKPLLKTTSQKTRLLTVNTSIYKNAGASIIQELAYGIAHGIEYLNYYGKSIENLIQFKFSVGHNYFFEIAKLRAFRYLWNLIGETFLIDNSNIPIFSSPSKRNKTILHSEKNLFKTATECASAILGGTNTIQNFSHTELYKRKNNTDESIARQQLQTLIYENDIAGTTLNTENSYFIEDLTFNITEKVLLLVKILEKQGGFLKLLSKETINNHIKKTEKKEVLLFNNRELKNNQKPLEKSISFEIYPFKKKQFFKTSITPIIEKRLYEKEEKTKLT